MNDDFENHLRAQPPRELPPHWRAEILAASRPAPRASRRWFSPSSIFHLPSPIIRWSPLAAAWLLIFALNHASRDPAPLVSAKSTPPSPQLVLALREQRRLFAELTEADSVATPTADRPRPRADQPRSQRDSELQVSG